MIEAKPYVQTYTDKVYGLLLKMEPQKAITLSTIVAPENRTKFSDTVKEFIRFDFGRAFGFYIEFSDDYSQIKKKLY